MSVFSVLIRGKSTPDGEKPFKLTETVSLEGKGNREKAIGQDSANGRGCFMFFEIR